MSSHPGVLFNNAYVFFRMAHFAFERVSLRASTMFHGGVREQERSHKGRPRR
jgi:hypothetical protein